MGLGGALLLVFIQPSYLTYSENIYRTVPFTTWTSFMWKGTQTDRTSLLPMAISDNDEMFVDSPQVQLLLKKTIRGLVHLPLLYALPLPQFL
jgi:hypothetical protein